jgi:hypothetical protein
VRATVLTSLALIITLVLSGCSEGETPADSLASTTPQPDRNEYGHCNDTASIDMPLVSGIIYAGEEKTHEVLVTDAEGAAIAVVGFLLKPPHKLDFDLITPGGTRIDPSMAETNPDIYHTQEYNEDLLPPGYTVTYAFGAPEQGLWTVNISATDVPQDGAPYLVIIHLNTHTVLSIVLQEQNYRPGDQIRIAAELKYCDKGIIGASVLANLTNTDTQGDTGDSNTLYDDGLHNDGQADDGLYANVYTDTGSQGCYGLKVTAHGVVNGEEFKREAVERVCIELHPDLTLESSDISFSNDNPDEGENITISAVIHNIGEGDAENASVHFNYDGTCRWKEYIGSDEITLRSGETGVAMVDWVTVPGDHEIYLKIFIYKDRNHSNDVATKSIHVPGPVIQATAGGPYYGTEGSLIHLDASGSTHPQGAPLRYYWYDDAEDEYCHQFNSPACFWIWDDDWSGAVNVDVSSGGLRSCATAMVTVENVAPIVETEEDHSAFVGDIVDFSVEVFDPGTKDTHTTTIDWGDGTIETGTVKLEGSDHPLIPISGNVVGSHIYAVDGVYTVTLTVTDDDNGKGVTTFNVTVRNK